MGQERAVYIFIEKTSSESRSHDRQETQAVETQVFLMVEQLFIASAWIWGIHALFYHLIFERTGDFLERILGTTVCKPLFICPPCQSSVHGFFWGLYFFSLSIKIIPFIICLTGLNYVIKTFVYREETSP